MKNDQRVSIDIMFLGNLPRGFNKKHDVNIRSSLFSIVSTSTIDTLINPDQADFSYSDAAILGQLPDQDRSALTIVITNVPLENSNFYCRRLADNVGVISFYPIYDIMLENNIPLKNIILRMIYVLALRFMMLHGKLPEQGSNLAHKDTRRCIFDFTPILHDIVYSTVHPTVCNECVVQLQRSQISNEKIAYLQKEIRHIRKTRYYEWLDYVKENPAKVLFLTFLFNCIVNLFLAWLYDVLVHRK